MTEIKTTVVMTLILALILFFAWKSHARDYWSEPLTVEEYEEEINVQTGTRKVPIYGELRKDGSYKKIRPIMEQDGVVEKEITDPETGVTHIEYSPIMVQVGEEEYDQDIMAHEVIGYIDVPTYKKQKVISKRRVQKGVKYGTSPLDVWKADSKVAEKVIYTWCYSQYKDLETGKFPPVRITMEKWILWGKPKQVLIDGKKWHPDVVMLGEPFPDMPSDQEIQTYLEGPEIIIEK